MDGAGAPKPVLIRGLLRTGSRTGLRRTPESEDGRDPVVVHGARLRNSLRGGPKVCHASSSTKNNQLRTGADKGNPTV